MAPYIDFLLANPSIKIHVANTKYRYTESTLNYLGIDSSRLISGFIRARVVYLPDSTACGMASVIPTQLLSYKLRKRSVELFGPSMSTQDTIILIQRTRK